MEGKPIVTRVDIRATVEEVWAEIVRSGSVSRVFFDTILDGEVKPGAAYRYTTPDGKRAFIKGRFLEVDPPRRLVKTFRILGMMKSETRVTWTLEPIPAGVRVTLVQEDLDPASKDGKNVAKGWTAILANLKAMRETGRLPLGMRFQLALMKLMLPFMPKHEE